MQDTELTLQQINQHIESARKLPLSQVYEACLRDGSGCVLRVAREIDYPELKELEQLYYDNLSASKCPIEIEWELLTEIKDNNLKIKALNAFVQKYARDSSDEAKLYLEKVGDLFGVVYEVRAVEEDWVNAIHENTIVAYKNFISEHPNSSYQREAEIALRTLKIGLIKDMKDNPCKYCRNAVHDYIRTDILSYNELVFENRLLTEEAYKHILRYPSLIDEMTTLPYSEDPEFIPTSHAGNIDVLSFGVSGSGGKTCLLASIMALLDNDSFRLRNRQDDGNDYAYYLAEYMKTNRLPPATDQSYFKVVDTVLRMESGLHGISFVEFAGERVTEMAGYSVEDGFCPISTPHGCYNGLGKIFRNDNKKILIFAIDPTNLKNVQIDSDIYGDKWVLQSVVFELLANLLSKDVSFCKKITGIHVVVTIKDVWWKGQMDQSSLLKFVSDYGYMQVISELNDICHEFKIMNYQNNEIDLIPFPIGKFMIGDTYKFDDTDAKRILEIIRNDISKYRKTNRIITSMTSKQIDAIRSGKASFQQLLEMCLKGDSIITIDSLRTIGYPKIKQLEELYYRELLNLSGSGQFQSIEAEWKMLKSLPFDSRKETLIQEFIQKLYFENTEYARSFRKKAEAYWEELLEENKLQGRISLS